MSKQVERLPGRCPHCGGTYVIDDGVNKCLSCSRTLEGMPGKKAYYLYNKLAILADINQLGQKLTRGKWKIPGGTMSGLLKRWSRNGTPAPAPVTMAPTTITEAELPPWSDSWPETVQLKWLELLFYNYLKNERGGKSIE